MRAQEMLGQTENKGFVGGIGEGGVIKLLERLIAFVIEFVTDAGGVMGKSVRIARRETVQGICVRLRDGRIGRQSGLGAGGRGGATARERGDGNGASKDEKSTRKQRGKKASL